MKRKSLNDLREEMRAVARGDSKAPPRPAASLTQALTREALELSLRIDLATGTYEAQPLEAEAA